MTDRHGRILGGLLGVAVGDALGSTVEFMPAEAIAARYGTHNQIIGGGAFDWRAGQGTDDTDLTACVLRGYLYAAHPGQSRTSLLGRIADNMLSWLYESDPQDIGNTTSRALRRLGEQMRHNGDLEAAGLTNEASCSNGSLMRCLPTALIRRDRKVMISETRAISRLTHGHPLCVDACVAYNVIAANLLHTPSDSPDLALSALEAVHLVAEVRDAVLTGVYTDSVEDLSTSGYVLNALTCAVWAITHSTGFEEPLVALVNRGDDADTTGAIAGGLLGCLYGADAIPERWLATLEYRAEFTAAADDIERSATPLTEEPVRRR